MYFLHTCAISDKSISELQTCILRSSSKHVDVAFQQKKFAKRLLNQDPEFLTVT